MNIVECTDVKKTYQQGKMKVTALGGVSLSIKKGGFIGLSTAPLQRDENGRTPREAILAQIENGGV